MNGEVDAIVKSSMVPLAKQYTHGIVIQHVGWIKWQTIGMNVLGAIIVLLFLSMNTLFGYIYGALIAVWHLDMYSKDRLIEKLTLLLIALGDGMKEREKDDDTNQTDGL